MSICLSGTEWRSRGTEGQWWWWAIWTPSADTATLCQCTPCQEAWKVMAHSLVLPSSAPRVTFGNPLIRLKHSSVSFLHKLYLNFKRSPRNLGDDRSCVSDPIGFARVMHVEQTGTTESHKQTDWEEKGERQGVLQMPAAERSSQTPWEIGLKDSGRKKPTLSRSGNHFLYSWTLKCKQHGWLSPARKEAHPSRSSPWGGSPRRNIHVFQQHQQASPSWWTGGGWSPLHKRGSQSWGRWRSLPKYAQETCDRGGELNSDHEFQLGAQSKLGDWQITSSTRAQKFKFGGFFNECGFFSFV